MRSPYPELAREIAQGFAREYAVLFGRARDALTALLEVAGARGPLLIPSNICPEVYLALVAAGHHPTLVAVSATTGLPDDKAFAAAMRGYGRPGAVMPTHLYGQVQPYPETRAAAREKGWLIVENDSLATGHRALGMPSQFAADAPAVVSFGTGKTIAAGVGGALLTNDARLAGELAAIVATYPPACEADAEEAMRLGWVRRAKRGDMATRLDCENALLQSAHSHRFAFPARAEAPLRHALESLPEDIARRRETALNWRAALQAVGDPVEFPEIEQVAPWRLIGRVATHRDLVLEKLRAAGIDAGDNYPALDTFFPRHATYAPSSVAATARDWQATVLNLWLTPDYPPQRIRQAAELIAAAVAGA
ncbi:MAG: DegT/DnrJ/EryC1/StrS family aminotransferase [Gallionellaceae bacterium]|nr:DegT/DnrJ/EryC1/StrS family aminotransferase [Gallionellaceae bacterium]